MGHITDGEDAYPIVRRLVSALPPGSYLVISRSGAGHRRGPGRRAARLQPERRHRATTLRTRDEFAAVLRPGSNSVEPGLVQVHQWHPDPEDSAPEGTVSAHGGVARKPVARAHLVVKGSSATSLRSLSAISLTWPSRSSPWRRSARWCRRLNREVFGGRRARGDRGAVLEVQRDPHGTAARGRGRDRGRRWRCPATTVFWLAFFPAGRRRDRAVHRSSRGLGRRDPPALLDWAGGRRGWPGCQGNRGSERWQARLD